MDWDKLVLFRKSRDSAIGFIAVKSIDMDSFGTGKARAEAAVWTLVNKLENCNERLKRLGLDVTSSEDLVAKAPGSDPTVDTKMPEPEVTKKSSRKRKREAAGETRKVKKFKKTPPATLAGEMEVEAPDPLTGEDAKKKKKKKNRSKMDVARTEEAEMPSKIKASKSKAKGSKGKFKKQKKSKKHKKRKEGKTAEKQR